MKKLEKVIAKSGTEEKTLIQHTTEALEKWGELKSQYYQLIPDDEFWEQSFLAVLFHDFGKIAEDFQNRINKRKVKLSSTPLRHEFLSGMYLFVANLKYYEKQSWSIFAVFAHHKSLNESLFSENVSPFRVNEDLVGEFILFAETAFFNEFNKNIKFSSGAKSLMQKSYNYIFSNYKERTYVGILKGYQPSDRLKYIFHKAVLHSADWSSSGGRNLPQGMSYDDKHLQNVIIAKLIEEKKDVSKFDWKTFQSDCLKNKQRNILAIAPTGSGKTEASLLWASGKESHSRIIYLLPTRVTSNAIFMRLRGYFGKDDVSLVHSSAVSYIKDIPDSNYEQKDYLWDKTFFKNVNICTVDQILTQGFNLGYWEIRTFHFLNARVIIDEIHMYQPWTLGLIISTIKYLQKNFNTTFFIMTATMPEKLQNLLRDTLDNPVVIQDKELLDKARNTFEYRAEEIDDISEEIQKSINAKKKVLIVVNTVDKAISIYEKYSPLFKNRKDRILCYHSRFIQKDRTSKEKDIFIMEAKKGGCLLIATQVVEVSLDIDFDILYTENAPIDAIIQRAGRVNRGRKKENSKVIICKHDEVTELIYDTGDILNKSFQAIKANNGKELSERELTKLVDDVYENYDVTLDESYKSAIFRYEEIQQKYQYIKDNPSPNDVFTREGLDTESFIPDCFRKDLFHSKDFREKEKHSVSVRRKRFHSIKNKEPDKFCTWFADVIYTYEKGVQFKSKERVKKENPTTNCF